MREAYKYQTSRQSDYPLTQSRWLTVKKVLAPSHLVGVPTALNQKIVKVQKPHVLLISLEPGGKRSTREESRLTGSLWSSVTNRHSLDVLLVPQHLLLLA